MSDLSFPTGTFSAEVFCGLVLGRPSIRRVPITRLDWLQKDSWPLYHQYLLAEITYNDCLYEHRIETLGKIDRSRMVVQALGLNALRPGALGNAKFQVQVWEVSSSELDDNVPEHDPPANLIMSMANVDGLTFREFESRSADSDEWYFTSVLPPGLSEVDSREVPSLGHLCQVLSSILQRAPDYTIEAQNCYFLCHTIILGLSGLCAFLSRLTWTLHALYRPPDLEKKLPWYRRVRGPATRFFSTSSSILYVDGTPNDHLRAIVIDGWGLCAISSFYQGIGLPTLMILWGAFALVPLIVCGAVWSRRTFWVACTATLAALVVICIVAQFLADRRWSHTLDRLSEIKNLVLGDIGKSIYKIILFFRVP
jgi:hypothetical protein